MEIIRHDTVGPSFTTLAQTDYYTARHTQMNLAYKDLIYPTATGILTFYSTSTLSVNKTWLSPELRSELIQHLGP